MPPDTGPAGIVYIIDDDDAVRDSTSLLLSGCGYAVETFASARAFLAGFHPAEAGCILLDLHMPQMGGLELMAQLRDSGIKTPVLVISGRRDEALDGEVRRHGVVAILSKPCEESVLLEAIAAAMQPAGGSLSDFAGR